MSRLIKCWLVASTTFEGIFHMRIPTMLVAFVGFALSGHLAAAGTVQGNVTLQFNSSAPSATQFHPNTTVPLDINFGVAKVTGVKFSADFAFATVGDFVAQHRSAISINHPGQLLVPGLATIQIQQSGLSNSFSETSPGIQMGAGAEVFVDPILGNNFGIPVSVLDVDLFIGTSNSNGGALGSTLTDSDTASAARIAVGVAVPSVIDVGTVGAAPTITGTSTVNIGASMSAILEYQHETIPDVKGMTAVSLAGVSDVMVNLSEPGIYDFVLRGYALGGTLASKTVPGINFDLTVFNNVVAERFLGISAAQQTTTRNFTFLPTNASQNLSFSIEVLPVPEPSSWVLSCAALPIAWMLARHKQRNGVANRR